MRKIVSLLAMAMLCFGLLTSNVMAQDSKKVTLAYVEWSDAVAVTNIAKALLEEEGYNVEIVSVSAAAMWKSVSTSSADGMLAAWLPSTHENYYAEVKDEVVNLGPNLEGTRIGLVVPEYVEIESISQLNSHADRFNSKIIGIDPGAGIMSTTEEALKAYKMNNMKLMESSGATMTAVLAEKIRKKEPVVVTGWTPHWKFARYDLKYLKDPKKVYGGAEHIDTVVRKGLKADMPEVYRILDNIKWTPEQCAKVMVMNQDKGSDPYSNAKKFLQEHPELKQQWLQQ